MTRLRYDCIPAALLVLAMAATAFAHQDDPKGRNRIPPYNGPGFRAAVDGPAAAAALGFPAQGVQLLAWLPVTEFGSYSSASDCWSYIAPSGREYAIIGLSSATSFVEVTNPGNPVIVATLASVSSTWRDIKVYKQYAYSVTEGGGGGIQVFDLSQIDSGIVTLVNTITGQGTDSTHNVALDESSGTLYRCGGGSNGLRIYDLDGHEAAPLYRGQWATRYVHDAQVRTYDSGPWAGRTIAFCCSGLNGGSVQTGLDILDVTDPTNIIALGQLIYPNGAYSHQAWLSDDLQYLYLNDELDENGVLPTTTFVINVGDLTNPTLETTFTNGNTAIGHNLYVRGDLIFEANYRSGLRVFDATDTVAPVETAYFDTWPDDDADAFNGLWSNCPYFPSGIVIGSDIERGLFVWSVSEPQIAFEFAGPLPDLVDPAGDTVQIRIVELQEDGLEPGSPTLHYSTSESFLEVPLVNVSGDLYEGTLPAIPCTTEVSYYFTAVDADGFTKSSPANAPGSTYLATSATAVMTAFDDDMESGVGYAVENIALDDGGWDRGVPVGGGDRGDPPTDYDGSGACWLTDNEDDNSDVDGGPTRLTTPAIDLTGLSDPFISYARWFTNDDGDGDRLDVEISDDDGASWTPVESVGNAPGWQVHTFRATDFITPSSTVRLRFSATDNPNDSVTEAGIDALRVIGYDCGTPCVGDVDGSGDIGFSDLLDVLSNWGPCVACPQDLDGSNDVGFSDLLIVLSNWGACP